MEDRPELIDVIEITPEMIEAGVSVLVCICRDDIEEESVSRIYRAMELKQEDVLVPLDALCSRLSN